MNYVLVSKDESSIAKSFTLNSGLSMSIQLEKLGITKITDFVQHLNETLQIQPTPLWKDDPKDFFSDHNRRDKFFVNAINTLYDLLYCKPCNVCISPRIASC